MDNTNAKQCPVCGEEIKDGGIKTKVAGRELTVCCESCALIAKDDPEKYAVRVKAKAR
jgi:ribosome-binding protein aMBF1 (putative translation factor)